jgi:tRNA(adenine34) deaminase
MRRRAGVRRTRSRPTGRGSRSRTPARARSRASGRTRARRRAAGRRWVRGVTTVSTYPPRGLFNRDAATIARSLASRRVSPKGPGSGLRMLLFYINRGGRGLSRTRKAELQRAKRLLQAKIARTKSRAQDA